jgi:diamine N-acetyltransferase
MTSIIKATPSDHQVIAHLGARTFIEAHGHSAPEQTIAVYVSKKYAEDVVLSELMDPLNIYHLIYHQGEVAGYSKINLNVSQPNISQQQITKLDRIYLLQSFHDKKLGYELLQFNIELSKQNHQQGMWLYVWTENPRAIAFYQKMGFEIKGRYDFALTPDHSNPNHLMFLAY